jgi:type II secretory ATPase GspE/PulE/Tfp pilus assembly ATPase PilB-like protein
MRLIDMGIEPYLVSSTLVGAMAQRLVRKICPNCKAQIPASTSSCPADFALTPGELIHRGNGCAACRQTGYRGRSGLYELMVMNETLSDHIMRRAPVADLIRAAKSSGLRLLREDGWLKVRRGITTPDEVVKCTAV